MRGHGMDMAERWRDCLADGTCEIPEAPAPPGGHTRESSGPRTSGIPTTAEGDVEIYNSGYDEEEVSEPTYLVS